MKILTWWNQEERNSSPEPQEYTLMVAGESGGGLLKYRDAEESDLYSAGFTSQETAMEAIKEVTGKYKRRVMVAKHTLTEVTEILRTVVQQYRECVSSGYTFEEFDNPEGLEEAIESAEAFLEEVE